MAIPIPHRASGFMLGDPAAPVKIDLFFDIQCPHSKRVWPTIVSSLKHYESQAISMNAHLITLSNHRQSWDMSLGLFALTNGDAQRFFDFTGFLFERQAQFLNAPFKDKTHQDLRNLVADYAHEFTGVDRDQLLRDLDNHDVYIQARTPIRYAATRAVWATPPFSLIIPMMFQSASIPSLKTGAVIDPLLT